MSIRTTVNNDALSICTLLAELCAWRHGIKISPVLEDRRCSTKVKNGYLLVLWQC
ncbi:hypothetical protein [Erwinia amylovora]|uniref:hypothetical protein n=1 Tax=Erwinia amylovora TaxID=552 RepID=UPI0003A12F25|nr:hypothetical protein [Erwinia amylovora]MBZ2399709.1 hypothetical protein [Erwinia amylovora]MCK8162495.1 hypothetical protein [Erwinia amylovora]MCK8188775.1 hypothetical protein [Erwinia amylovora]MCK8209549.1 hypothetical protein [Erwinia amylovora]MCK8216303.1 hypothetical protein [Erwinia amylovora]